MQNSIFSGFFNILKPCGPSSSDIVVKVRKITGIKKIGHLGTLDPYAAGVLPVAVGKATKLFDLLAFKEKKYRAVFTFGIETDTGDSDGIITETSDIIPSFDSVKQALKHFTGEIDQIPHRYSAVKIEGQKAYDLAREGKQFILKSKKVYIKSFELLRQKENEFTFDIVCSGGTYIRSLCRDLASLLKTNAYMSMLIRLSSGAFDINNSVTLKELEHSIGDNMLDITYPIAYMEKIIADEKYYKALINGIAIDFKSEDKKQVLVYCGGEFFGIGSVTDNKLKVDTFLKDII